ncbi:uncharacterized protein RJT20DRAFT_16641 [Scheffersomyces xylosifermentans]|uniref:uncharacterized protein n=1 Tax=Scheffersomyces xylosifermentans TaxID=1304137 RepID=UPI00315D7E98
MDIVNSYLGEIAAIAGVPNQQHQIKQITSLLSLDPASNPYIVRFNSINVQLEDDQISKAIDAHNIFNDEWLAFNEVVLSFIRLSNQLNPWSSLESFDLYGTFINDLSVAFNNNNRGYLLSYLVRDSINIILPVARKLDSQLYIKEHCGRPRMTYLASILLKIFNNIRSQINDVNQYKKTIILYISNKLCSIYFQIDNPLLCRNIFSNMNNANLNFKSFSRNEQVQYRYYLAKFYLIKSQVIDSYDHFLWCLLNCPSSSINNINHILKYLLPISLIIGKIPNFDYINQVYYRGVPPPAFLPLYAHLSANIKSGNFKSFNDTVVANYQYLKENNMLLLLVNKSKVIILRNLVKKVWINTGRPTNLDYDAVKLGVKLSLGPDIGSLALTLPIVSSVDTLDDDAVIENIFITIIDQNLLKGKIFPRLRKVALSKTGTFPKVDDINIMKFSSNRKSDSWMNA